METLIERLKRHPELAKSIERMLDISEDVSGKFALADDVEGALIAEVQGVGLNLMKTWAEKKSFETSSRTKNEISKVALHGKKKLLGKQNLEK